MKIQRKNHRSRCVVCGKLLKIFEMNLCSCKQKLCMKHKNRESHDCPDETKITLVKVVAPKLTKI